MRQMNIGMMYKTDPTRRHHNTMRATRSPPTGGHASVIDTAAAAGGGESPAVAARHTPHQNAALAAVAAVAAALPLPPSLRSAARREVGCRFRGARKWGEGGGGGSGVNAGGVAARHVPGTVKGRGEGSDKIQERGRYMARRGGCV